MERTWKEVTKLAQTEGRKRNGLEQRKVRRKDSFDVCERQRRVWKKFTLHSTDDRSFFIFFIQTTGNYEVGQKTMVRRIVQRMVEQGMIRKRERERMRWTIV